jgi:hypothetical protein
MAAILRAERNIADLFLLRHFHYAADDIFADIFFAMPPPFSASMLSPDSLKPMLIFSLLFRDAISPIAAAFADYYARDYYFRDAAHFAGSQPDFIIYSPFSFRHFIASAAIRHEIAHIFAISAMTLSADHAAISPCCRRLFFAIFMTLPAFADGFSLPRHLQVIRFFRHYFQRLSAATLILAMTDAFALRIFS